MKQTMSHGASESPTNEIQFRTPFGYMFQIQAESKEGTLPKSDKTITNLTNLAEEMDDPGDINAPASEFDSNIPAIMTYFGQFIDHEITAKTDRDPQRKLDSAIAQNEELKVAAVSDIVGDDPKLTNGRRPHLDLDSVYGDGPPFPLRDEKKEQKKKNDDELRSEDLYDDELLFKVRHESGYVDLVRGFGDDGREPFIADKRNDENVILSQFHAAVLLFHNRVAEGLSANNADGGDNGTRFSRARQLVRWCYQYIVANEYLPAVCDPAIVDDVLRNGPRHFGPGIHATNLYMPLEFSVAAFRFAHSMIRPFYDLNDQTKEEISKLLQPSAKPNGLKDKPIEFNALEEGPDGVPRLRSDLVVRWSRFVPKLYGTHQYARKIDPRLAKGLFFLHRRDKREREDTNLRHLARRNLLRGYELRIPTGQAVAWAMGITPLSGETLLTGDQKIDKVLKAGDFTKQTPLWYYILREAQVHHDGDPLGAVGSRLVAETLIGLLKNDPNSYLNNMHHQNVTSNGIDVWTDRHEQKRISSVADLLEFAAVPL